MVSNPLLNQFFSSSPIPDIMSIASFTVLEFFSVNNFLHCVTLIDSKSASLEKIQDMTLNLRISGFVSTKVTKERDCNISVDRRKTWPLHFLNRLLVVFGDKFGFFRFKIYAWILVKKLKIFFKIHSSRFGFS